MLTIHDSIGCDPAPNVRFKKGEWYFVSGEIAGVELHCAEIQYLGKANNKHRIQVTGLKRWINSQLYYEKVVPFILEYA